MVFARSKGTQTSHIVKLFSHVLLPFLLPDASLLRPPPLAPPLPRTTTFIIANEQRLPAKDDERAALRHRLQIKILLTAESEFHFKVEFNYIRACLPAPSRFLISPGPSVCPIFSTLLLFPLLISPPSLLPFR